MPTSQARILANQANAARSTGPKTLEGKERSRANALKHGLTGSGAVLIQEDAAEVEQLTTAMTSELQPSGTMGRLLIRRIATLSVRLERSVEQETASLTERVRQVDADFIPPEDSDDATADRLRLETCRRAMFDPSKEATLARRYEAAAERGFFRAWKEFRLLEREAKTSKVFVEPTPTPESLGSFFPVEKIQQMARAAEAREPIRATSPAPANLWEPGQPLFKPAFGTDCDVPFTIGKPRRG